MTFRQTWRGNNIEKEVESACMDGLTETAADGEALLKSPAPTGWPRDTSFLANSSGHQAAKREGDMIVAKVTVDAEYWIYVNAKTQTMERMGEAVSRTIGDRVKARL